MPTVTFKGRKYILRWKPEWDVLLKETIKNCKVSNKRTDWKKVVETGILNTIPVSFKVLRCRPGYWKNIEERKEKNRVYSKQYQKEHGKSSDRLSILRKIIVKDVKGTKAHSWSKEQKRLLFSLAKKYKEETFINWKGVLEDPKSKNFPCRDRVEIAKLYFRFNRTKKRKYVYPEVVRKRYLRTKLKNRKEAREMVWNFLLKQLKPKTEN